MDTFSLFNQQGLQCQDNVYTLAWYLLANEEQAEAVTQAAVKATDPCFSSGHADCRLLILKQVVEQCWGRKPASCDSNESGILQDLHILVQQECVVLVPIDILRLGFQEASIITAIRRVNLQKMYIEVQ